MPAKPVTSREIIGLGALTLSLFIFSILTYYHLGEDAFISFRYVRNFANGHGLVYNAGEHVEGYSNLLWVLLLTPFEWLGVRLHVAARLLSTAFFAAAAIGGWWVARRVTRPTDPQWLPWWLGVAIALDPLLHFHDDQGLETVPYVALLALAWFTIAGRGRIILAGAIAAAATLTRPEGIGFVAALAPAAAAAHWEPGRPWRVNRRGIIAAALFLALPVAAFAAQLIFRKLTYGEWVPNTMIAKRAGGPGGLSQILAFTASRGFLPVLALAGFALGLRAKRHAPLAIGGMLTVAAAVIFQLRAGGLLNTGFRYQAPMFVPVATGVWMLLARVTELSIDAMPRSWKRRELLPVSMVLLAATPVLLVGHGITRGNTDAPASRFHVKLLRGYTYNFPERSSWFMEDPVYINAEAGRWARTNLPSDALLAADQMGMFGFYAGENQRIIDLLGLMDAHVARHGLSLEYLGQRAPQYLVVEACQDTQYWPREMRGKPHVASIRALFDDARFRELYRPRWFLKPRITIAQTGFLVYVSAEADDGRKMEEVYLGLDDEEFEKRWRVRETK